jgi:membrane protein implicated in regulation of membrane protease activity
MFKSNVGLGDRVIRIVLGLLVVAMVFVGPKIIFGWLGVYPLVTGALGYDPLYRFLKIDTHPPKHLTGGF